MTYCWIGILIAALVGFILGGGRLRATSDREASRAQRVDDHQRSWR
jgi:hypothetical protein